MPTKISELLTLAARPTVAVVAGVDDQQLDLPTPCAKYQVRELLDHVLQVVVNFQALAARESVDWSDAADRLTGDWRGRFATETRALAEAWADPAALEGVSPQMRMPQQVVGGMVLLDLVVHGWDLARATSQPYAVDPAVLGTLLELVRQLGPQAQQMGVFAEPVPVPSTADELTTLLAATGRDPSWAPPAG